MKVNVLKVFMVGLLLGLFLMGTTVIAANTITSATFNNNRVVFNGVDLDLTIPLISVITADSPDTMSNYMPVRAVLEAMGYNVDWDGANNAIIVTSRQAALPLTTESVPLLQPLPTPAHPVMEIRGRTFSGIYYNGSEFYNFHNLSGFIQTEFTTVTARAHVRTTSRAEGDARVDGGY